MQRGGRGRGGGRRARGASFRIEHAGYNLPGVGRDGVSLIKNYLYKIPFVRGLLMSFFGCIISTSLGVFSFSSWTDYSGGILRLHHLLSSFISLTCITYYYLSPQFFFVTASTITRACRRCFSTFARQVQLRYVILFFSVSVWFCFCFFTWPLYHYLASL